MGGSPARHTALKTTSSVCLSGEKLEVVQKEVADMLKGRVLVGHALHNDLKVPLPDTCWFTPTPPRAFRGLHLGLRHSTGCRLPSSARGLGGVLEVPRFSRRHLRPSCSFYRR